jgi:hypothetical protein
VVWIVVEHSGVEWSGVEWSVWMIVRVLIWSGVEWSGVECGVEWFGL